MYKKIRFENLNLRKRGFYLVKLSSENAEALLQYNELNRRVRKTLVEYLKKQIANGEWQDNHPQPIVLASVPVIRVIDGQHRLIAIAESELDAKSAVSVRMETCVDVKVREYLDTGVPRTLDDRVSVCEDRSVNRLAAQLVTTSFVLRRSNSNKYAKPTPSEALEFFKKHESAIYAIHDIRKHERAVGQIPVAYAAMEYYEQESGKATEFYRDMFTPAGSCHSAQMLRNFLITTGSGARGSAVGRREIYAKAVGCMKAHRDGVRLKKVYASEW